MEGERVEGIEEVDVWREGTGVVVGRRCGECKGGGRESVAERGGGEREP